MSNNLAENLFIVTAPSGAGKTTLIKNIIAVSYTHLTLPTTPYV